MEFLFSGDLTALFLHSQCLLENYSKNCKIKKNIERGDSELDILIADRVNIEA